jgi:WD40 repeat protein
LFDFASKRRLAILGGHGEELRVALFAPSGSTILTADAKTVLLWTGTGDPAGEIPEAEGRDWTCFSPDGLTVLSQDRSKVPTVFETSTGKPLRRFPEAGSDVWEAWFALDGSELGAIDYHGNVVGWETRSGKLLWRGRGSGVNTGMTVVSPDRRWMATVVGEQTVDLWDLKTRRLVRVIERHIHPISTLAFSPGEAWLASGDESGEVWIWPLRLADEPGAPPTQGEPIPPRP